MKLQLQNMSGVLFACGVTAASSSTFCYMFHSMFLVFIPRWIPIQNNSVETFQGYYITVVKTDLKQYEQ